MIRIAFGILLLLAESVTAAGSDSSVDPADGLVEGELVRIPDTSRHEIVSSFIDDTFKVYIYYPRGYHDMKDPIPVVYLLDAEYSFGAIAYTVRRLIKDGLIPPTLLVGVAYEVSYEEYYRRRERDFTPEPAHLNEFPHTGGGKEFAKFIREELVPFVNQTYRVDPNDRTITGLSLSGFFCVYLLFNEPGLFDRYVIVSPSLWWNNGIAFEYEADFRKAHESMDARVYFAAGEHDGPAILKGLERMEKVLATRNYNGLEYCVRRFPDETHRTVFPIAVSHGLRFVFENMDD